MSRSSVYRVEVSGTEIPVTSVSFQDPQPSPSTIPTANISVPFNTAVSDSDTSSEVLVQDILDTLTNVDIYRNGELRFPGEILGMTRSLQADGLEINVELTHRYYQTLRSTSCDAYPATGNVGGRTGIIENPWDFSSREIGIKFAALGITPQVNYNLGLRPDEAVEHIIEKRLIQYRTPNDQWVYSDQTNNPMLVSYQPDKDNEMKNQKTENNQATFRFGAHESDIKIKTTKMAHGSIYLSPSDYGDCTCEIMLYGFRTKNNRGSVVHLSNDIFTVEVRDTDGNWQALSRDTSLDDWNSESDLQAFRSGWSGDVTIDKDYVQVRLNFENTPSDFKNDGNGLDFADVFFMKANIENEDSKAIITPGTIEQYDPNPPNLLVNGGFEFDTDDDDIPDDWTENSEGGLTFNHTIGDIGLSSTPSDFPGEHHLRIGYDNSSGSTVTYKLEQEVTEVEADANYSAGIYIDYLNGSDTSRIRFETFDSSDTQLDNKTVTTTTDGHLKFDGFKTHSNTDYGKVTLEIDATDGTTGSIRFDGFQLYKGETLESFIGTAFGKETYFNYNFYGSNRLKALGAVRETSANDYQLTNPYYDLWIDTDGKLHFEKQRGDKVDEDYSFSDQNILRLDINRDDDIFNTIEAVGAGEGALQTRVVGSIKDTDSIGSYGRREYSFRKSEINDIVTLEAKAWAFLKRNSQPRMQVDVDLRPGYDQNLYVGDRLDVKDPHYGINQELRVKSIEYDMSDDGEEIKAEFFESFPSVNSLFEQVVDKTDGTKNKDTSTVGNSPTQGTPLRFSYTDFDDDGSKEAQLGEYSFYIPDGRNVEKILLFARTAPFDAFSQASKDESSHTHSVTHPSHSHDVSVTHPEHFHTINSQTSSSTDTSQDEDSVICTGWSGGATTVTSDTDVPNSDSGNLLRVTCKTDVDNNTVDGLDVYDKTEDELVRSMQNWDNRGTGSNWTYWTFLIDMQEKDRRGNTLECKIYFDQSISSGNFCSGSRIEKKHSHSIGSQTSSTELGTTETSTSTTELGTNTTSASGSAHSHGLDFGIFKVTDSNDNDVYPQNVKMFMKKSDASSDNYVREFGILNKNGEDYTYKQHSSDQSDGTDHYKYNSDQVLAMDVTDRFRNSSGQKNTPIQSGSHTIYFGVNDAPDSSDNPKNLGKIYVNHMVIRKEESNKG